MSGVDLAVVVGGQFGSEAKGHVTKRVVVDWLAKHADSAKVTNIRVAGPNAGHCAYDAQGRKWALRTVPMAVVIEDPRVKLHIAAGSEIDPDVLFAELNALDDAGLNASRRLTIHPEATVLTHDHIGEETGMHERIGSTGKGIGAARAARIMRTANRVMDDIKLLDLLSARGVIVVDFDQDDFGVHNSELVIVEGTQGYGLGLHAGFYPRCTSSDARAIHFLAMAGLNPWHNNVNVFDVYVVARVYPIRVAGNSGPLAGETSWEELGLPEEFTTVTKKVRRVGGWDGPLVRDAVRANGGIPTVSIALTMVDQKFPDLADAEVLTMEHPVWRYIEQVSDEVGAPVSLITTGEDSGAWL